MFNSVILFNMALHSFVLFYCIAFLNSGLVQRSNAISEAISPKERPKVILFSFDGFRHDFINPVDTPNLYTFSTSGVRGHMIPSMVTKTYPNHQSIVTGLYQPYHGVVNNKFYDPLANASFNVGSPSTFWWDQFNRSVPIYIANEYYEPNRYSGTMQWPGALSFYTNGKGDSNERRRVHYFQDYEKHMPWKKRIDTVMEWLTHPTHPANLVLLYFDEPDSTSHQFGPFSKEVKEQIKRIDQIVGYFRDKLVDAELIPKSNLIFLSDHGMSEVRYSSDSIFILKDCEKLYPGLKYEMHGVSPTWSLTPLSRPSNFSSDTPLDVAVRDSLNDCAEKLFKGRVKVYLTDEVPKQWHYSGNRRLLQLFLLSDDGTEVYYEPNGWKPKGFPVWGNHGYNNTLPSMRPLFIASGRAFKTSFVHPTTFENVDLYPLILHLLQIPVSAFPSNGTIERVREMLNKRLYLNDEDYIREHSINNNDPGTFERLFFVLFCLGIGFGIIVSIGLCFVFTAGFSRETAAQRRKRMENDRSLMAVFFKRFNRKTNYYDSDYRMFHRPTSHLDSSLEEDDDNGDKPRSERRSSQRSLTDIDWDIVGTGLDIDLASELNPTGRSIERWHENERDNSREQVVLPMGDSHRLSALSSDSDSDDLDLTIHDILSRHNLSRNDQSSSPHTDTLIDI